MTDEHGLDALVVGAGFAGLYAVHSLRAQGLSVEGFEAAGDVGGVWYWNQYPGARCDAQSLVYCYMFDEELYRSWRWSEHYAAQSEILRYINHVADRLDLRRSFRFNTRVVGASFDRRTARWTVRTHNGDNFSARYLIFATGILSAGKLPEIEGIQHFAGEVYHTGRWPPSGVDFRGKRVGVIGTGSSGVQIVPEIANQADQLVVFQRTPAFIVPSSDASISEEQHTRFLDHFSEYRERMRDGIITGVGDILLGDDLDSPLASADGISDDDVVAILQRRWDIGGVIIMRAFRDVLTNQRTNDRVADFLRSKIARIVKDPAVASKLTPRDYPVGSKRLCVGTRFYETFNRPSVELVSLFDEPIERVIRTGLSTSLRDIPLDVLVFATGYDAFTGALDAIEIVGSHRRSLREQWSQGAEAYLGLAVAGFPNMFILTGPGSPAAMTTVTTSIEQHVDFMMELIHHARTKKSAIIEVEPNAQKAWTRHVSEAAAATLLQQGKSWYLGANVPGKPRIFLALVGGTGPYRRICSEIAAAGFRGFRFKGACASRAPLTDEATRRAG